MTKKEEEQIGPFEEGTICEECGGEKGRNPEFGGCVCDLEEEADDDYAKTI